MDELFSNERVIEGISEVFRCFENIGLNLLESLQVCRSIESVLTIEMEARSALLNIEDIAE